MLRSPSGRSENRPRRPPRGWNLMRPRASIRTRVRRREYPPQAAVDPCRLYRSGERGGHFSCRFGRRTLMATSPAEVGRDFNGLLTADRTPSRTGDSTMKLGFGIASASLAAALVLDVGAVSAQDKPLKCSTGTL